MAQDVWSLSRKGDLERLQKALGPPDRATHGTAALTTRASLEGNNEAQQLKHKKAQKLPMASRVRWVGRPYH